jgi:predicted cation transporter
MCLEVIVLYRLFVSPGGHKKMDGMLLVNIGLFVIFLVVLIGPFRFRPVEQNLEVFLLACGVIALTISGFATIEGYTFGWTAGVVTEALTAPLLITTVFGVPVGIVQIVLLFGLFFYFCFNAVRKAILWTIAHTSIPLFIFLIIVILGLVSSLISAILAALVLVEMVCALPINRGDKISVTVVACFSIGLGAALTPLGEPLSTIATSRLSGPPYYAGFDFLFNLLGLYIIPGIIALGIVGVIIYHRSGLSEEALVCELRRDTLAEVAIRSAKVYVFIMALIFLGEGFKPLIVQYVVPIPATGLYWVNMISAVLDNATLAAAEINPVLSELQIKSALMGLIIAGGMLIPGNIPNIISAGKIGITSREWAKIGIPAGLAAMIIYFAAIFVPAFLSGL